MVTHCSVVCPSLLHNSVSSAREAAVGLYLCLLHSGVLLCGFLDLWTCIHHQIGVSLYSFVWQHLFCSSILIGLQHFAGVARSLRPFAESPDFFCPEPSNKQQVISVIMNDYSEVLVSHYPRIKEAFYTFDINSKGICCCFCCLAQTPHSNESSKLVYGTVVSLVDVV